MVRLTQVLTAAIALVGTSIASAVVDLTPDNFDEVVLKSGKPALVEFFAPWCGHCKTLAPIYDELATSLESQKDKVTIAKVDADAHRELGTRFGIQGFPTIKWFDGKSDSPEDYKSGRDLDSLKAFVAEKAGAKPKTKKALPSPVEMLTNKSFKELIGKEKEAIVAFTAPWCGHCKTLAPIWEKVAHDFATEANVLIAKVDCEAENAKDLAKELGISSYPTIFYYPKGQSEGVAYTGGRSQSDIVSFMNEKAGTHRVVGGGLDALAGTIPSLDTLVANLKEGGNTAYQALEKAASAAKDQYGVYYAKVAKKAEANSEYVQKEITRLQKIINKGDLAPEKLDDLVSRSNILQKFKGEEAAKDEL